MLHVTLLEPHPQTPTSLLVCPQTYHRTVIDPVNLAAPLQALGADSLDLILLTAPTEFTLAAAEALHARTGAPILAGENLRETRLPVARYLGTGEIVGLGPLAQTLWLPEGGITAYGLGKEELLLSGPLFATGVARHKANAAALTVLTELPPETRVLGGGAYNVPLGPLLQAALAG